MFNIDEELPSPRAGNAFKVVGIATLLVLLAIAGYVFLNRVEPPAAGEILAMRCYLPEAAPVSASVVGAEPAIVPAGNRLLVLAPVRISNMSKKPMSVQELTGVVRLGDTDYKSDAASSSDFEKVFQYYPDLAKEYRAPFATHEMIQPGATLDGLLVFNYSLTEEEWNHAASFEVNVSFDQRPEILHLKWATFPAHEHIENHTPPSARAMARGNPGGAPAN